MRGGPWCGCAVGLGAAPGFQSAMMRKPVAGPPAPREIVFRRGIRHKDDPPQLSTVGEVRRRAGTRVRAAAANTVCPGSGSSRMPLGRTVTVTGGVQSPAGSGTTRCSYGVPAQRMYGIPAVGSVP